MAHNWRLRNFLRTWLRLFRVPNLFTVPGDPLAGFLLAGGVAGGLSGRAAFAAGASLCFYASGLLMNDAADLEEDRRERPERPLPSGAANRLVVRAVAIVLAVLGLMLCLSAGTAALLVGFGILLCVALYNDGRLKEVPVLGALNMGLCRGLSLLLGAAAASGGALADGALPAAIVTALYIAAVTHLARHEMRPGRASLAAWLPCGTLLAGGVFLAGDPRFHTPFFLASFALACLAAGGIAARLRRPFAAVPPGIGALIRVLLFIQAAFCAVSTRPSALLCAAVLLFLWPVSRAAGRRFAGS